MAKKIDLKMKHHLFPLQLSSRGLIQGNEVVNFLYGYLGKKKIQHLPIKYASVALDLDRQSEIIIDKGDLVQAIRSSISIPVVFVPHAYYGHIFSDSGFINPVPVTAARAIGATRIIAVNVLKHSSFPSVTLKKTKLPSSTHHIWDVLLETIEHAVSRLVDYQSLHLENGVLININTSGVKLGDFEKATQAIDMGYTQAKKYRNEIKSFLAP
jgi:predicted acylesterase/phospholipase RssA